MDTDFLLYNNTAKKLFFEGAADMPIFDWHCHLSPKEIYENKLPILRSFGSAEITTNGEPCEASA